MIKLNDYRWGISIQRRLASEVVFVTDDFPTGDEIEAALADSGGGVLEKVTIGPLVTK